MTLRPLHSLRLAALAGAAALLLATSAPAQEPKLPRVRVGAGLGLGLLVGEDGSDFLDGGTSRWLGGTFRLDAADILHLHLEGARLPLEPDEDEASGNRAENTLTMLVAGPQVGITLGPLRPYLAGLAGITVGRWEIENEPDDEERSGSETTFTLGGRAGLAFDVDRGDHPVSLLAEAQLLDPGELLFARALSPSGGFGDTVSADVAVLSLRVGVTLGF